MGGMDTVFRILEKIEVGGVDAAVYGFTKMSNAARKTAGAMKWVGGVSKSAFSSLSAGIKSGAKGFGESIANTFKAIKLPDIGGDIFKGNLAANLATKAIDMSVQAVKAAIAHVWELNEQYDDMQDKITGIVVTSVKWGKEDPAQRMAKSLQVANALMVEFKDTAIKTATPLEEVAEIGNSVNQLWSAAGRSQLDVAKATDALASSSKVLGLSSSEAMSSLDHLIKTGKARRGQDPFGIAIGAEAGIKKTDSLETRIAKVQKAMSKVGAPVADLVSGTEEAMQRWKTLSNDVLQQVTKPIFDKIGGIVQGIVDWTLDHRRAIDEVVVASTALFESVWAIGKGVWDTTIGIMAWFGKLTIVQGGIDLIVAAFDGVVAVVDMVGSAWAVVSEAFEVAADPSRGLGKMNVLFEGFEVKILRVLKAINEIIGKMAKMILPDWIVEKLPDSVQGFIKDVTSVYAGFDNYVDAKEKKVAADEKRLGMAPSTSIGRREASLGMSDKDRDKLLGSTFGQKRPILNIEKVEIHQDFRDQDPDNVLIEFTRGLERLGERALQSTVGGAATVYGPGSRA